MDTPKVYVLCDNNCKYEGMTREQILAAIANAVATGSIGECDTGFVSTIKTINGYGLKFFIGEQHEYDALTEEQKQNLFAIITNDTTKEGLLNAIEQLNEDLKTTVEQIKSGAIKVGDAKKADNAFKFNGLSSRSVRGHGTAFEYEPLVGQNIDYYGNFEGHYFIINSLGTLPAGAKKHGFLDVDKFSGTEFAPNGQGAEPICRQTFREYNTGKAWVRTYNHNTTVSGVWTAWEQIAGGNAFVSSAKELQSNNTLNFAIGTILTAKLSIGGVGDMVCCGQYVPILGVMNTRNICLPTSGSASFVTEFINSGGTVDSGYSKINGVWRVCGISGEYTYNNVNGYLYIIQRIE